MPDNTTPTEPAGTAPKPSKYIFHWVLSCPCGTQLTGDTEDEIVEVSLAHLREQHPDMASNYEREHVLFMAQRLVKGVRVLDIPDTAPA